MYSSRLMWAELLQSQQNTVIVRGFEIAIDSKGPLSGPTLWSGFEVPDQKRRMWWPRSMLIFPPKVAHKNQNWKISITTWISHQQSIDNSLLSYQKIFITIGPKRVNVMAKKRMPKLKYGHVRHTLAITWPNMNIFNKTNFIWFVPVN